MRKIRLERLKRILEARSKRGAFIVSFVAITVPQMVKKHRETGEVNPFSSVKKRTYINGVLNFNYRNAVNRQRQREELIANFEPLPRAWGDRVDGTPFVVHVPKGQDTPVVYLEVKVQRLLATEYVDDLGRKMDSEALRPYLKDRPIEGERQGVEHAVVLRDYKLSNIESIAIDGNWYNVTNKEL